MQVDYFLKYNSYSLYGFNSSIKLCNVCTIRLYILNLT